MPVVAGPEAAPVPSTNVPAEATNAEATVRAAVDGPPEIDVLALPVLWDELRVLEQVVKDVGGEDRLTFELLLELGAHDRARALLLSEVEVDEVGVPFERVTDSALDLVFLVDAPALGDEWGGGAVDAMGVDDDFSIASEEALRSVDAAQLVENCFDRSQVETGVLHRALHCHSSSDHWSGFFPCLLDKRPQDAATALLAATMAVIASNH